MLSIDELKATYAKFSDFKLSKLLGEIDSLTPEAQQVLKAEVEKRNLVNIDFAPISAIEPSVVKEKKIGVAPVSDRFFNYLIDMGAFMAFGILFFVYGDPILSSLPPKLLAHLVWVPDFEFCSVRRSLRENNWEIRNQNYRGQIRRYQDWAC